MEDYLKTYLERFLIKIRSDKNFYTLGIEDGVKETKKEIVLNLFKDDMPIDKICNICGWKTLEVVNLIMKSDN